jgi:hypothetical protein
MGNPRGSIGGNPKVEILPVGNSKMMIVVAGNYVGGISHQTALRKFDDKKYADAYVKRLKRVI